MGMIINGKGDLGKEILGVLTESDFDRIYRIYRIFSFI